MSICLYKVDIDVKDKIVCSVCMLFLSNISFKNTMLRVKIKFPVRPAKLPTYINEPYKHRFRDFLFSLWYLGAVSETVDDTGPEFKLLELAEVVLWIILQLREFLFPNFSWMVIAQVQLFEMKRIGLNRCDQKFKAFFCHQTTR